MPKSQPNSSKLSYKEAQIVKYGSDTFVIYYVPDGTGKLKRVKKRCNAIIAACKNNSEARKKLTALCKEINTRLAATYKPVAVPTPRNLVSAMDLFLSIKERELRPDTMRSYSYFCRKFSRWLLLNEMNVHPDQLDRLAVIRFLDDSYLTLCPRSYNNLLKYGRTVYAWFIERGYAKHNVFADIQAKKTYGKKRKIIPKIDRDRITKYLQYSDPEYLVYLRLIFKSLIRPKEARMLKVGDIYPGECRIVIRPEIAKTHIERSSYCPPDLIVDLVRVLHIDCRHPEELLFNGKSRHYYLSRWHKLRKELNLPDTYQMYSLRDTGITEYLHSGLDTLTVMQLAGHTDLSTTSIYARHADNSLYVRLANKSLNF